MQWELRYAPLVKLMFFYHLNEGGIIENHRCKVVILYMQMWVWKEEWFLR